MYDLCQMPLRDTSYLRYLTFIFLSLYQDANNSDKDISELRSHQQLLSQQLEDKQKDFHQLQSAADTLDGDIERLLEIKQLVSYPSRDKIWVMVVGREW